MSQYVCRGFTTNASQVELFLDGISQRMVVPVNTTWTFDGLVTGRATTGSSVAYQIRGAIKNTGGTTVLVGSPTITSIAQQIAGVSVSIFAGDANDVLLVDVTGAASTTIRWVASVRTVEVSF